ncbi:MAG: hypothetical protein MJ119_01475 [Lachnospiraceae bacterium]|nr:hypothetical protein [Lachnospiraceae bacterium]
MGKTVKDMNETNENAIATNDNALEANENNLEAGNEQPVKTQDKSPQKKITHGGTFLFFSIFAVFTVFYFLFLKRLGVVALYENIDDLYLKIISSGELTGISESHLLHITFVSGSAISFLYRILPGVSWYGIYMTVALLVSFSSFFFAVCSRFKKWSIRIVSLAFLLFFYASLTSVPSFFVQYTTVTIILAAAAVALFYCDCYIAGAVLYILSFSVRIKASVMILPVLLLLCAVRFMSDKDSRKKLLVALSVAFAGCILIFTAEKIAYSGEEWKAFTKYNTARENIYDYNGFPDYYENTELYDSVGVSEADWLSARDGYLLLLDNNMNADTLPVLADATSKHSASRGIFTMVGDFVERNLGYRDRPTNLAVYLLYLITFVLALVRKEKTALYDLAALFAGRMIIWGYLIFINRYPERITHGVYIAEAYLLIAIIFYRQLLKFDKKAVSALVCTLTGGLVILTGLRFGFPVVKSNADYSHSRQNFIDSYGEVREYFASHPENVYLLDTNSFLYFTEPLLCRNKESAANCAYLGCWTANSPWTDEVAHSFGFDSYEEASLAKDNVYFVFMDAGNTDGGYLKDYYKSKYPGYTLVEADRFTSKSGPGYVIFSVEKQN